MVRVFNLDMVGISAERLSLNLMNGGRTLILLFVCPFDILDLIRESFHTDFLILRSEQSVEYTPFVLHAFT